MVHALTSLEFNEFLKQNGIRHLTSAPYHPATNGIGERYVQTFKVALKKGSDNDLQRELSRFLFRYRKTPHSTTGISLAQLLMGRPLKTHLDFLRPDLASKVREVQGRQKVTHDRRSHFRLFQTGDQVFIRNFVAGPKWLASTILKAQGPLSYEMEMSDGRVARRHVDHIRIRTVPCRYVPTYSG